MKTEKLKKICSSDSGELSEGLRGSVVGKVKRNYQLVEYTPLEYFPNIAILKYKKEHTLTIEENFQEVLKEIRKEKGFSQEKLAAECELDRTYISMIERGVSSPTLSKLVKISAVLGVNLSEIFKRCER